MTSDNSLSSLERLKQEFPVFVVKNKAPTSKQIILANNETVQVQPGAEKPIKSADLVQMPDSAYFKMISPSVADLVRCGVLTKKEKPAPIPNKVNKPNSTEN